ncbi:hypothetical protein DNTS_026705 [Danionella cerebrum]|uniref:Receptor-type tyrosine-protein phosphatase C n=1 Tax=Danionella cerebrum TaxID=2873325 RepID=A0A553RKX5_9TELE|nr:hypothetical protein DNTS_026705 [Danionella translucida]
MRQCRAADSPGCALRAKGAEEQPKDFLQVELNPDRKHRSEASELDLWFLEEEFGYGEIFGTRALGFYPVLCLVEQPRPCFGDQSGETTQNHSQISKDSPTLTTNPEGKPNNDSTNHNNTSHQPPHSPSIIQNYTEDNTTIKEMCNVRLNMSRVKVEVEVKASKNTTYHLRIMDNENTTAYEENGSGEKTFQIPFENLSPCTRYNIKVKGCSAHGNLTFNTSGNNATINPVVKDNEVCLEAKFTSTQKWNLTKCIKITEDNSCEESHVVKLDTCNYTIHLPPDLKKNSSFSYVTHDAFEVVWNAPQNDPCSQIEWENYELSCSPSPPKHSEALLRVEPIYAEALTDTYITKNADDKRLFMEEFQSIPRIFSNYTLKEAKKDGNQSKNRYIDILPYDYTRVVLSTGGDQDYINASFIDGYQEPKKYIAAQGPKEDTVGDFWQMIWDQKSSIIVMVTRCEEGNKPKCAQYWPCLERETEIFDDFVVKIKTEQHCPDYIIRHLVLANKREMASEREVTHIQFISWPDHGVPGDPFMLLKLRRRVNSFKNFFSGPIVVHCSAGVGRTGTYISIDAMIESLEAEGRVDIYGYVVKLRRQRCLMVQVEPQYILIHAALIEHYQYGDTEISLSEFHSVLNTLRQKDGADGNLMEIEFQKIPKCKNWRTFNTASSEENKSKNRDSKVLPYDINRVLFRLDIEVNQTSDPEDEEEYSSDEEEESNEYINASFLEGYWGPKSLIAAQGPLPNTMAEFLLMLIQQRTKTLVMLTDCEEDGKDYCSQYWGEEKKVFGELEVEMKKEENFPAYVRRHLEIYSSKKKEIFKVDQYQFLKWKGRELPENAQELIEMIHDIKKNSNYDNSKISRRVPIVVHCNNGSSRTGIFCALWNLMDSASSEKFVDVFQVVKNLRKDRLGMVQTLEQYQFIYAALEGAFPVQNGTVKTLTPNHSEQLVINETTALLTETNCTSSAEHQEATDDKQNIEITEQEVVESETPLPPAEVAVDECSEEPAINGPTSAVNEVEISLS